VLEEPDPRHSWLEKLIEEVGRAVQAGNAQTARWIIVLVVAAAALSLVLLASH
jgi:hypothetical protein